jgi:5-formyltetrahydrofolate cyclo-ligase
MEAKGERRKEALAIRAAENPQRRAEADRRILENLVSLREFQNANTIFSYVSTTDEVDTSALIERALCEGKRICVPLCISFGVMQTFAITGPDDLRSGKYDIPEPKPHCKQIPEEEIDLTIVPCVCADREGYRLGYGGGFYDRWMEKYRATSIILCRESIITESVPRESHDQCADILITDAGVWYFFQKY